MKKIFLYVWISDNKPFGVFDDKKKADAAIAEQADNIKTTVENLKLDLYYYELPLNKLVIIDYNVIL